MDAVTAQVSALPWTDDTA